MGPPRSPSILLSGTSGISSGQTTLTVACLRAFAHALWIPQGISRVRPSSRSWAASGPVLLGAAAGLLGSSSRHPAARNVTNTASPPEIARALLYAPPHEESPFVEEPPRLPPAIRIAEDLFQ